MRGKALCQKLWERLPPESLMILDRHYGQPPMLGEIKTQCDARDSHFLVRVLDNLNVKVRQPHADGRAKVAVNLGYLPKHCIRQKVEETAKW